jgi:hypothetical protein
MSLNDHSGTIASGGSPQPLMPANASRNGFMVQNSSAGDLWINEMGANAAASEPSIKIAAGTTYTTQLYAPCPNAVSIFGATTSQAFTCLEW